MDEQKEPASTPQETEESKKNEELSDADLDKVAGGHASLTDSIHKVHDKTGHATDKIHGIL